MKKLLHTLLVIFIISIISSSCVNAKKINQQEIFQTVQKLSESYDQQKFSSYYVGTMFLPEIYRTKDPKKEHQRKKRWFIKEQTRQLKERYQQELLDKKAGIDYRNNKELSSDQLKVKYPIKWFDDRYNSEACEDDGPPGLPAEVNNDLAYGAGYSLLEKNYCFLEDDINSLTNRQIISLFIHYDDHHDDWRLRNLVEIVLFSFNQNPEKHLTDKINIEAAQDKGTFTPDAVRRLQNQLSYLRFFIIASGSERIEELREVVLSDYIAGNVKHSSCMMLKLIPESKSYYTKIFESSFLRPRSLMYDLKRCTSTQFQKKYLKKDSN